MVVERIEVTPQSLYFQEHLARYEFARQFAGAGPLLDIACGTGYGSNLLLPTADSLTVGVDIEKLSLYNARRTYTNPKLVFLVGDGTSIPFCDAAFATVISTETIEHIPDVRSFLAEIARVVQPSGICVISTPNRIYSEVHGITNPFHIREYDRQELLDLLSGYFRSIDIYYQGFSSTYHANIDEYSLSIQQQKKNLTPILREAIDRFYRPVKRFVPTKLTNWGIRTLLRLEYPQPAFSEITISPEPLQDCSNLVAVCKTV